MRKIIYFFAAFLVMFSLTSCKVSLLNDNEFYIHKDASLQDLEFDFREEFNQKPVTNNQQPKP